MSDAEKAAAKKLTENEERLVELTDKWKDRWKETQKIMQVSGVSCNYCINNEVELLRIDDHYEYVLIILTLLKVKIILRCLSNVSICLLQRSKGTRS